MSPAGRGARLPGEAPQPFCERCGRSVEAATIGLRVGLCHCPSCDLFACRSCWSEAAESLSGVRDLVRGGSAAEMHSEALAAGALAANALRGEDARGRGACWPEEPAPVAEEPAAVGRGTWSCGRGAAPSQPAAIASPPPAIRRWKTRGVPIGFGVAVARRGALRADPREPVRGGWRGECARPDEFARLAPRGSGRRRRPARRARARREVRPSPAPTDPAATEPSPSRPTVRRRRHGRPPPRRHDQGRRPTPRPPDPGATPTPRPPATPAPTPTPPRRRRPTADADARAAAGLPDRAGSRRPDRREGPRHVEGRRFHGGVHGTETGLASRSSRRRASRPVPACLPSTSITVTT